MTTISGILAQHDDPAGPGCSSKVPPSARLSISHPRVLRRFDVRRLVVAGIDKRGRLVGPIETSTRAQKETRRRFRCLAADESDNCEMSWEIASCLFVCGTIAGGPCESLACPMCARTRRIVRAASVLEFFAAYDPAAILFVTLINPADALQAGELRTLDPVALEARLRRQLERAGLEKNECALVGCLDGEWDAGWEIYQPHYHFLVGGISKPDLRSILKDVVMKWPLDKPRVRARRRMENVDDLPRVAAYLDKSFWPAVARKNNLLEIHPYGRKRRPPPEIEREIMHWFHAHQGAELRFHFGVKSLHGKLVRGSLFTSNGGKRALLKEKGGKFASEKWEN